MTRTVSSIPVKQGAAHCHPEPAEGRRRKCSLVGAWFDTLTMTRTVSSFPVKQGTARCHPEPAEGRHAHHDIGCLTEPAEGRRRKCSLVGAWFDTLTMTRTVSSNPVKQGAAHCHPELAEGWFDRLTMTTAVTLSLSKGGSTCSP